MKHLKVFEEFSNLDPMDTEVEDLVEDAKNGFKLMKSLIEAHGGEESWYFSYKLKHGSYQPSVACENDIKKKTGKDVQLSKDWKLPYSLTHKQLDYILAYTGAMGRKEEYSEMMDQLEEDLYVDILNLNPHLKELDRIEEKYFYNTPTILMGVASKFNLSDMKFFMEIGGASRITDPEYKEKIAKLEEKIDLQWVPSPDTLDKIYKAVFLT